MNKPKPIKLGYYVKDVVNGLEGSVIGMTAWLTGCDTVQIEPKPSTDGRKQDSITLDINRVEYLNDGVRPKFFPEEYKEEKKKVTKVKPGGPHDNIKPARQL